MSLQPAKPRTRVSKAKEIQHARIERRLQILEDPALETLFLWDIANELRADRPRLFGPDETAALVMDWALSHGQSWQEALYHLHFMAKHPGGYIRW